MWSNQAVNKQNKVKKNEKMCFRLYLELSSRKKDKNVTNHQKNTGLIFKLSHRSGFDIQIVEEDWKMYFLHVYMVSNLSRNTFFRSFSKKKTSLCTRYFKFNCYFLFFSQSNIALTQILKHNKNPRFLCGYLKRFPQKWYKFIFKI